MKRLSPALWSIVAVLTAVAVLLSIQLAKVL